MNLSYTTLPPQVTEAWHVAAQLSSAERLLLARLLLDSLIIDEAEDEHDWQNVGLRAFEQDWDNPEDAIYDNWRELYGLSTG
jgi:hypothetical protein